MADKVIISTIGRVGSDPLVKTPKPDMKLVEFRLAVPLGYDRDAPSQWYDVSTFNEGLIDEVMAEVSRGSEIAVRGELVSRVYQDKTYLSIRASRIWITQALKRSDYVPVAKATEEVPF